MPIPSLLARLLVAGTVALAAPAALAGRAGAPPDRVELKSGATFGGRVVYEDDKCVLLDENDRLRRFSRESVASVTTREMLVAEILDRLETLGEHELDQRAAVARRAQEVGLSGEAEIINLGLVLTDPEREDARLALGHKRIGSAWRAPWKGEWLPLSSVARSRYRWANAWEFETAHYRLRTNIDLPTALEVALDLEIAYRAFYEVIGKPLGLHHVSELLEAHVHGDPDALPYLDEHIGGFFDEGSNTLIVDATRTLRRGLLFHEVTHQLLHNTHAGMVAGTGHRLPLWVNEGLAEFMTTGLDTRERGYDFDWAEVSVEHVRAYMTARDPITVERVVSLRDADFRHKDRGPVSYAMAYTLVDFCMHADSGRHQGALMRYLAQGYADALAPEDFVTLVADDVKTFEADWRAYVEEYMDEPLRARLRRRPPR
jgi:hypothetical protein